MKTQPSYDNVQPGWDNILYHGYDSPEYFEDLRQKGYPEHLLNHDAIHEPNVPSEGPGDHLPLRYPAHYSEENCECRFVTNRAIDHISSNKENGLPANAAFQKSILHSVRPDCAYRRGELVCVCVCVYVYV